MLLYKNSVFYIWRPDGIKGTCLPLFKDRRTPKLETDQIRVAKASLDLRLLVVQLRETRVVAYDVNTAHSWTVDIKSPHSNRIMPGGVIWSEHSGGSQDLILATTRGLEMWKISPQRKQCKLSRTVSQGLSFHAKFLYEPNFRLDALASLGPLAINGYFFKTTKETLPKLELPPPDKSPQLRLQTEVQATEAEAGADASTGAGTADEDMSLQTIYGNLFLVVRKDAAQKAAHNMDVLDMYLLTKNRCVDVYIYIYIYIYIYTYMCVCFSFSIND
eukprot:GSChrysophyteH2.ASY1.ANO1.1188.1 assembled CDS